MLTIQPDLAHNYRTCRPRDRESKMCFEILGYDVILDENCRPYLLEVNHAPSFSAESKLDYQIKYNVIHDTMKMLNLDLLDRKTLITKLQEEKMERFIGIQKKSPLKKELSSLYTSRFKQEFKY